MADAHEQQLAETFVALSDTLVDEFNVLDFLNMLAGQAADLLNVTAAGVVLCDQRGEIAVTGASSQDAHALETLATQTEDGPCQDCVRHGVPVTSADLNLEGERWPQFVPAAANAGYRAVAALPMRLRGHIIGALTLLNAEAQDVDNTSIRLGQALADVATIGILQQRAIDHGEVLAEQLQSILHHQVVVEQAKGVLTERGDLTMSQAHALLRGYARAHRYSLTDLAHEIAEGRRDGRDLFGASFHTVDS